MIRRAASTSRASGPLVTAIATSPRFAKEARTAAQAASGQALKSQRDTG